MSESPVGPAEPVERAGRPMGGPAGGGTPRRRQAEPDPAGPAEPEARKPDPSAWTVGLGRLAALVNSPETDGQERERLLGVVLEMSTVAWPAAAQWATISQHRHGRLSTSACTGSVAAAVDALQYATGQGPCVQALADERVVVADRLDRDPRWPQLTSQVGPGCPVRSALSVPLPDPGAHGAVLNLYSHTPAAFAGLAEPVAVLIAAAAAVGLAGIEQRMQATTLRRALRTSRRIGAAVGILMCRHRCSDQQAFAALRQVSQRSHRKVVEVAEEVLHTGALPR